MHTKNACVRSWPMIKRCTAQGMIYLCCRPRVTEATTARKASAGGWCLTGEPSADRCTLVQMVQPALQPVSLSSTACWYEPAWWCLGLLHGKATNLLGCVPSAAPPSPSAKPMYPQLHNMSTCIGHWRMPTDVHRPAVLRDGDACKLDAACCSCIAQQPGVGMSVLQQACN